MHGWLGDIAASLFIYTVLALVYISGARSVIYRGGKWVTIIYRGCAWLGDIAASYTPCWRWCI